MKFLLFLECSQEAMIARIMKRDGEPEENKKDDDNLETLMKRFKTF